MGFRETVISFRDLLRIARRNYLSLEPNSGIIASVFQIYLQTGNLFIGTMIGLLCSTSKTEQNHDKYIYDRDKTHILSQMQKPAPIYVHEANAYN